ncbi:MAG: HEPN domain-containing protein [Candidatus Saganbacteria bacterium]|nr:HEPN domain-containing protein [Candidatus Saganbacteria bacterium]
MNAEIEEEKQKIIGEWEQRADDDLESAEIILRESDNYDISAYHSHQAIEKLIKACLLRQGEPFKFIHDISTLFLQAFKNPGQEDMFEKISYINSLYPKLRYPSGDQTTKEQAEKCLQIAKEFFVSQKQSGKR